VNIERTDVAQQHFHGVNPVTPVSFESAYKHGETPYAQGHKDGHAAAMRECLAVIANLNAQLDEANEMIAELNTIVRRMRNLAKQHEPYYMILNVAREIDR
jgi:flagellar biosynthesis/type III secretory pathway protein FliH